MDKKDCFILKAVKCGYFDGVTLGKKNHLLDRIMPVWVHRLVFRIQLLFYPSMKGDMIKALSEFPN